MTYKNAASVVYKKPFFRKKPQYNNFKMDFNSVASNKKGLAILINNNFEYTFVKLDADDERDSMVLQLKMNDQSITLVNLHSPNIDDPLENTCIPEL